MKTTLINKPAIVRYFSCAAAVLGLGIASAVAASPIVTLSLGSQDFGVGNEIHATSKLSLTPSTSYKFKVVGTCVGTGSLAGLVKSGTPISALLSNVKLSGTHANPGGKLPIVVFDKKYKKTQRIQGLGKVTLSAVVKGGTTAAGKVYFDVTNVKISSAKPLPPGTIRFEPGAKLVVTAAPVIQFKATSKNISESGGVINLEVTKVGNDKATVQYSTADLTADSSDYTPASGTLNFGPKTGTQVIPITILPDNVKEGFARFTVTLSSPTGGAVLGTKKTVTVGILDDD